MPLGSPADLRLDDMRGGRCAGWFDPLAVFAQEGRFFLGARDRDADIILTPNAKRRDVEIVQNGFDLRVVHRLTGKFVHWLWGLPIG